MGTGKPPVKSQYVTECDGRCDLSGRLGRVAPRVAQEANRFPHPGAFGLLLMRAWASGIKKSTLAALSLGAASLNIGFCLLVA